MPRPLQAAVAVGGRSPTVISLKMLRHLGLHLPQTQPAFADCHGACICTPVNRTHLCKMGRRVPLLTSSFPFLTPNFLCVSGAHLRCHFVTVGFRFPLHQKVLTSVWLKPHQETDLRYPRTGSSPFLMILTLAVTFHPQRWGLLHLPTAPLPLRGPCHVKFKDHQS